MNLDPDCLHRREFYGLTASAACGGAEPHIGARVGPEHIDLEDPGSASLSDLVSALSYFFDVR